jgi:hypothetical protein
MWTDLIFFKQPKGSTISGESHMLPNNKQILPTKMITCGTINGHWIKACTWCGSEQKMLTSKKNIESESKKDRNSKDVH